MYRGRAKEYANDIKLSNHLIVPEEEDILMDSGAHAVAVGFAQILGMQ
jgi:hypothetical protein